MLEIKVGDSSLSYCEGGREVDGAGGTGKGESEVRGSDSPPAQVPVGGPV